MEVWKRNINKLRRRGQSYYNRGQFSLAVNLWKIANRIEKECKVHYFPRW